MARGVVLRLLFGTALAALALLAAAPLATAQPEGGAPPSEATKSEARQHFERGVALSEAQSWDAALAEFTRANELYATRGASRNAAVCLRKLHRYDEAVDMLESVLARYADMPPDDRWAIEHEVTELMALVGNLEVRSGEQGAQVLVDERARGATPLAPVRVSAGSHLVRVYKQGFVPFELRVEVAGRQKKAVEARLVPLTQSGELDVVEASGKAADVLVDGVVVGKAPWTGRLTPGEHIVVLRGEGNLGTQPATTPVRVNQTSTLRLAVETLAGQLRVEPSPADAQVTLDGARLGSGVWEGRVRAGTHAIDVLKEGYLPGARSLSTAVGARDVVRVELEQDPSSPLWGTARRSHISLELRGSFAFTPSFGGGVSDSCSGGCSSPLPLGERGALRATYELASGLGFALDVGYVRMEQTENGRPVTLSEFPSAQRTNPGTAVDQLALHAVSFGLSAGLRFGDAWMWGVRLGAGVMVGTMADTRTAQMVPGGSAASYSVGPYTEAPTSVQLYLSPELFVGRRFGRHIDVRLGVDALGCFAAKQPSWQDKSDVVTPTIGFAGFGSQSLTGVTMLLVLPTLSFGYVL